MDQLGNVANPARGQLNRENEYPPVTVRTCLRIWSRETGPAVPSRVSLLISILRLNLVLTYGIFLPSSAAASIYEIAIYAIGSVPSVILGHAIACRWRSLPRVRRHRASKPQGVPNECCCLGRSPWTAINMRLTFPPGKENKNKK